MIFSRGFTIGGNLPASFDNRAFYGAVRSNKSLKGCEAARLRRCRLEQAVHLAVKRLGATSIYNLKVSDAAASTNARRAASGILDTRKPV